MILFIFDSDLFLTKSESKLKRINVFTPNYPRGGGGNYHPLSENCVFSGPEPPLDPKPVCKLKFVRCGPGEENQSTLSFLVEAWRPDEVREHLFPNSEIEIFIDFCRFSTNFPIFQKLLRGPVV